MLRREPRLGRRLAERVQVHADEVDRRDPVLGDRRHVLGEVAAREQAAVHRGVQGLHAAVEHLRELRHVGDVGDGEAGGAQGLGGAAGGEQGEAEGAESGGELDQAGLVGDGEEGGGHR